MKALKATCCLNKNIDFKLFQLDENTLKMLNCEPILNISHGFATVRDYSNFKKSIRKCLTSV